MHSVVPHFMMYHRVHMLADMLIVRTCKVYLLSYLLINYSMEQSSSREANRFSASQEIPHTRYE